MGKNDRLNELLSAYIDGEVTPSEKAEVEKLLQKDQVAAELYSKLSTTKKLLGSMQPLTAPAVLSKRLTQQFRVLKHQNFFSRLRSMFRPFSVPVPVFTYLGALIILIIVFFYSSSVLFIQPQDQESLTGESASAPALEEQEQRFALDALEKSESDDSQPSTSTGMLQEDSDQEKSEAENVPLLADAGAEKEGVGGRAEGTTAKSPQSSERPSKETFAARENELKAGVESPGKPAETSEDNRIVTITGEAPLVNVPEPAAEPEPEPSRDEAALSEEIARRKSKAGITIDPKTGKIMESPPLALSAIDRNTYRAEILQETIQAASDLATDESRQVSGYNVHSVFRGGKKDKRLAQYFTRAQTPASTTENTVAAPIPDIDFQAVDPAADDLSYIVTGEMQVADNGKILQLRITGHPNARFLIDAYADHLETTPLLPAYDGKRPVPVFYRFIATIHKAR